MLDAKSYERIKQSTVAVVAMLKQNDEDEGKRPFTILGSGFCVDRRGVIVTCRHVVELLMDPNGLKKLYELYGEEKKQDKPQVKGHELDAIVPYVVFYHPQVVGDEIVMLPVRVRTMMGVMDHDLALMHLQPHSGFRDGYPFLEPIDYKDVQETMPIGACGFPLGDYLQEHIGTVGSSFSTGSLSSIIPIRGVSQDRVSGFLLNISVTNGNSGGPVFSNAGKVVGVISQAVVRDDGVIHPGLTKAEPIYPVFVEGRIERLCLGDPMGGSR